MVLPTTPISNSRKLKSKDFLGRPALAEHICPEEGANKPDIVVLDKEKNMAYVIEGTICEIGKIEESILTKQNKYTDLRYGLKRLYSLDTIIQINVVMDFVGGYHSKLVNDFINLFGEREQWLSC